MLIDENNPYVSVITDECRDFSDTDWLTCKERGSIYREYTHPYELIRSHLKMNPEEFRSYILTSDFVFSWTEFCDAEQYVLEQRFPSPPRASMPI